MHPLYRKNPTNKKSFFTSSPKNAPPHTSKPPEKLLIVKMMI